MGVHMQKGLIRIGRAVLLGLAWAAAWVPVGLLAAWLVVGELDPASIGGPLYAGFLCGAMFSMVAGIADGRRELAEMSLQRSGARGAVAGLLVGGLWVVLELLSNPPQWILNIAVVGSLTLLSAGSGVGSALLARMVKSDARAHARFG
jgi:hypothetical protein